MKTRQLLKFLWWISIPLMILLSGISEGKVLNGPTFQQLWEKEITMPKYEIHFPYYGLGQDEKSSLYFEEEAFSNKSLINQKNSVVAGEKFYVRMFRFIGKPDEHSVQNFARIQNAFMVGMEITYQFVLDKDKQVISATHFKNNRKQILWKNSKDDPGIQMAECYGDSQKNLEMYEDLDGEHWGLFSDFNDMDLSGHDEILIFVRKPSRK